MPEGKKRTKKSVSKKTKRTTKKPVAQAALAVPKSLLEKKFSTKKAATKKRSAKKVVRTAKRKAPAKTVTVPIDISPSTPPQLPTPIAVKPLVQPSAKRSARVARHWPLHHHLFGLLTVVMSAIIAVVTVYQYTEATLLTIAAYDGLSSALTRPTKSVAQVFSTDAGELTMTYPESWSLTDTTTNAIKFSSMKDSATTIDLAIEKNDTDTIFSWLTEHEPSYTNAKVIEPTNGVKALGGILMTANDEDNAVQVVYFPVQVNPSTKYIVSLTLTYPNDSTWVNQVTQDYQTIVNQVRFNSVN